MTMLKEPNSPADLSTVVEDSPSAESYSHEQAAGTLLGASKMTEKARHQEPTLRTHLMKAEDAGGSFEHIL